MQVGSVDLRQINPEVVLVGVCDIRPSKFKIRERRSDLEDLKKSIIEKGLIHPIVIRVIGRSSYEVVAGSQRLWVFRELGRSMIPAIIANMSDQEAFELILTENIQREALSPLEEAQAFYAYVGPRERNCYGYGKVSELAKKIGKSQEYVSNRIRLLRLPEILLRKLFLQNGFTVSHAEELVTLSDSPEMLEELSMMLMNKKVSVRELEEIVALMRSGIETKRAVELAKVESDLKLEWDYRGEKDDRVQTLMKRTEVILKSVLSYVDNVGEDLDYDQALFDPWIGSVRLKVHDAINGVLACKKLYEKSPKPLSKSIATKR